MIFRYIIHLLITLFIGAENREHYIASLAVIGKITTIWGEVYKVGETPAIPNKVKIVAGRDDE